MTFVILTGGIDLSVGSILAISGAVCASLLVSGKGIAIAVLAALVIGTLVGFLNGFIITKGKLQPFIATLATMTVLRGLTLVYTDGKPITLGSGDLALNFGQIGGGKILGIPTPALIMIVTFALCAYVLKNTKMGRYTYALGSNEEATRLSGLNTDKIKIAVYTISGILASVAGIIITSRLFSAQPTAGDGYELDAIAAVVLGGTSLTGGKGKITGTIIGALIIGVLSNSAQPTAGDGYELDAIAAVVLGGTSLTGGKGKITGTIIGALIIGVLSNALNILDVSSYYQMMVKGAVILVAVLLDRKSN